MPNSNRMLQFGCATEKSSPGGVFHLVLFPKTPAFVFPFVDRREQLGSGAKQLSGREGSGVFHVLSLPGLQLEAKGGNRPRREG